MLTQIPSVEYSLLHEHDQPVHSILLSHSPTIRYIFEYPFPSSYQLLQLKSETDISAPKQYGNHTYILHETASCIYSSSNLQFRHSLQHITTAKGGGFPSYTK